ncbi:unnamed protein product [Owenia fusiformis]|uniref:THD domain-containing protein n=1 Tax=Owenia fusiformis TaxID=6347 RepID=A0A8J1XLU6_OWEFU|nr:unnamed protein product [Owenia fusiformis]
MKSLATAALLFLVFDPVQNLLTIRLSGHMKTGKVSDEEPKRTNNEENDFEHNILSSKINKTNVEYQVKFENILNASYPNDIKLRPNEETPQTFESRMNRLLVDEPIRARRTRRTLHKKKSVKRKSKKSRRGSIHVIPKIKSKYPLATSFDKHGNINSNWEAVSTTRSNLKLRIDSPRNASLYNAAYIMVKYTGNYFVYGQVFFHGQKHEMGHCLHVADTYKPCSETTCDDKEVMCSRTAAGHPENDNIVYNINTNYVGGVVYLKRYSTIRLAIDVKQNINKAKSIELDTSLCYFGAFSV